MTADRDPTGAEFSRRLLRTMRPTSGPLRDRAAMAVQVARNQLERAVDAPMATWRSRGRGRSWQLGRTATAVVALAVAGGVAVLLLTPQLRRARRAAEQQIAGAVAATA